MDIKSSPSGRIITAGTGYKAFIPNPLPPSFGWTTSLVQSLSRADHALGKLSQEGNRLLPNPHLFTRPFIAREAVLSSKIEGTRSTLGEILADQIGAPVERDADDLQEVKNYIDALDYGLNRLNTLPLSLRLIKEVHQKLMAGVRGEHATPGEFRYTQNWIGIPGSSLMTAKFVPPPPSELMQSLGEFENFLYDRTLPPLVHIALCHYQFEAIHPFLDGNGRVGRLLIILLMIEHKLLQSPLLYLSAFFEATRDEYYRQLYKVSAQGSWQEWLEYFFNGVAVQSVDVISRAERINSLIVAWQSQVNELSSISLQETVRRLAENPFVTATNLAQRMDIAYTTAQRIIGNLENMEIISQVGDSKRDRVYCALKIKEILEEPTKLTIDLNEE